MRVRLGAAGDAAGRAASGIRVDAMDRPESNDPVLPPEAWPPAHAAAARLLSPLQQILAIEATSGLLLLFVAAAALVWANSAWSESYVALWHMPLGVSVGGWSFVRPLHFWVNDGLM